MLNSGSLIRSLLQTGQREGAVGRDLPRKTNPQEAHADSRTCNFSPAYPPRKLRRMCSMSARASLIGMPNCREMSIAVIGRPRSALAMDWRRVSFICAASVAIGVISKIQDLKLGFGILET
jgi:hypothetical protein